MENRTFLYKTIVGSILTFLLSLYLFPIVFTFFPIANTKVVFAACGLGWFIINMAMEQRKANLPKDLLVCFIIALLVSLAGLASMTINNTMDTAYASYVVSMCVWLGGAYFCVNIIKLFHKEVNIDILCNYIIAVGVFQCISVLLIKYVPYANNLTIRLISDFAGVGSMAHIVEGGRNYGFGAALDPSGTRFAAMLIILACVLTRSEKRMSSKLIFLYILSFFVILVIGNMVARTTTVGAIIAIGIIGIRLFASEKWGHKGKTLSLFISILLLVIGVTVYMYNHNTTFQKDLRFAFEGFFALVEDGYWHTNSNDNLQNMYIFPDNPKTWLIGDGYFNKPDAIDGNYFIGYNPTEYYKGTDVGYCRFLFYFGLTGLILFMTFFVTVGHFCSIKNKDYKWMFTFFVLLNFIIWFKVATDIFLIFALFLCLPPTEETVKVENYKRTYRRMIRV